MVHLFELWPLSSKGSNSANAAQLERISWRDCISKWHKQRLDLACQNWRWLSI